MFATADLDHEAAASLSRAIAACREGQHANATLLPLLDAIDAARRPPSPPIPEYVVTLMAGPGGPVLADEGSYGVSLGRDTASLIVRGAVEELVIRFSAERLTFATRRPVEQRAAAQRARFDLFRLDGTLDVRGGGVSDLSALAFLLDHPAIIDRSASTEAAPESQPPTEQVLETELLNASSAADDDAAQDSLVDAASNTPVVAEVDVPLLWRTLMDVEQELTIEGVAIADSGYRAARNRHTVPFQTDRGSFDGFEREDRVLVEKHNRRNAAWRPVGLLDVAATFKDTVTIEPDERGLMGNTPLVRDGERLKFTSFREMNSRSLRERATARILTRQSVVPALIDVFAPAAATSPRQESGVGEVRTEELRARYGLNQPQADVFRSLLAIRPVGLLQGPPGTGKTKFIASFVHHALNTGLVRNVLLASQSHEAVNTAAEAVLRLFRDGGEEPSLVRVGQEGSISEPLRPFHAERVEARFKDLFRADRRERLSMIATRLGIAPELTRRLMLAEFTVRPVLDRLIELGPDNPRTRGLIATADRLRRKLGLTGPGNWLADDAYSTLIDAIAQGSGVSAAQVGRFLAVSALGRDWLGSVATPQRSFETFLAGTRAIVAGTCVGLGRSALGLTQTKFDLVVVDEAARCTSSELAVPMQSGGWVLLVGDHRQLEPHHRPEVVRIAARKARTTPAEILRSDFERVFDSSYGAAAGRALSIQYRMAPPIGRVVSKALYDGRLTHGRDDAIVDPKAMPLTFRKPLTWIDTDELGADGRQRPVPHGRSLFNEAEADAVIATLRGLDLHEPFHDWLRARPPEGQAIGIICTYAAQRDQIARRLPAVGLTSALRDACKIDTVDSYQGKENPIVILSLVRNNEDGAAEGGVRTIAPGFMARPNRINVAVSRAMDHLVVIGARRRWRASSPMGRVVAA